GQDRARTGGSHKYETLIIARGCQRRLGILDSQFSPFRLTQLLKPRLQFVDARRLPLVFVSVLARERGQVTDSGMDHRRLMDFQGLATAMRQSDDDHCTNDPALDHTMPP